MRRLSRRRVCIISCILGHLSWSDGSWPVDFSLDVDLECNLERILKGLLHWQWIAGAAGFFVAMYMEEYVRAGSVD